MIVEDVRLAERDHGYDARTEQMGDMFELGIVDPVKVVRVAIENAVSVAALMLTTESLVGEIPEPTPAPAMPGADMGMGGMGGMGM